MSGEIRDILDIWQSTWLAAGIVGLLSALVLAGGSYIFQRVSVVRAIPFAPTCIIGAAVVVVGSYVMLHADSVSAQWIIVTGVVTYIFGLMTRLGKPTDSLRVAPYLAGFIGLISSMVVINAAVYYASPIRVDELLWNFKGDIEHYAPAIFFTQVYGYSFALSLTMSVIPFSVIGGLAIGGYFAMTGADNAKTLVLATIAAIVPLLSAIGIGVWFLSPGSFNWEFPAILVQLLTLGIALLVYSRMQKGRA